MLAHSARTLMDRFNESLWSGDLVGSEEPDEQAFSQGCAAWFADSNKKALLAEIGVGTLDQAMMAVMPFKHNNLRLLGLSNKILLADEIHACDAYMSCILEGLIERQGAWRKQRYFAFCHVISTAARQTRCCLCAWCRGPARSSVPGKG